MFTVTEINVVGDLLCPLKVLSVLKRISDEDCQLLGLNPKYARPDWLILQVLPIPPPPVRPSDDLTHQLAMIIRHNENLKRQERNGSPAHIISEFAQLLQFHIATYFDNELPGLPRSIFFCIYFHRLLKDQEGLSNQYAAGLKRKKDVSEAT
ncbi:DNA-directed RNA polymerase II subunit 1 [Lathyrus oleraceus]|uniref:DNA-directed RNA polymerase n=1 Tax=Pisum sativum TaxID=3888 RepID=A0A9D5BCB4_PEA|nr:DNA-directed RNA polymerase II subunit 1 [Pisum sativum]